MQDLVSNQRSDLVDHWPICKSQEVHSRTDVLKRIHTGVVHLFKYRESSLQYKFGNGRSLMS